MKKKKKYTIEETFNFFWQHYHEVTKIPKTDKAAAMKKWNKFTINIHRQAYLFVGKYFDHVVRMYGSNRYVKKARTYLEDKVWEDEYVQPEGETQKYQRPKGSIVYDRHN